jgi:hypothetical protein
MLRPVTTKKTFITPKKLIKLSLKNRLTLIIHIPHSSFGIPPGEEKRYLIPQNQLLEDMERNSGSLRGRVQIKSF